MSSQDSAIGITSPDNPDDKFEGIDQSAQKVRKSHEPNALHSGFNRFKDPDMQLELPAFTPTEKIPFVPSKADQFYI